ncbi:hypothetical protein CY34DRAFT_808576 [Suillus luteus UH-Slu-Lm8-n1]|uniref:Uncharacterized protein n=1 Tax=Suillus luteus UH-Slu-Lm8-n1 TaxID=930992 RepID=A0A0D0AXP4_9AGAM|nr:hypothetical protein CY34DRAFT_808576 [Suillus luteus UH-Slu-Lm8-n1]
MYHSSYTILQLSQGTKGARPKPHIPDTAPVVWSVCSTGTIDSTYPSGEHSCISEP